MLLIVTSLIHNTSLIHREVRYITPFSPIPKSLTMPKSILDLVAFPSADFFSYNVNIDFIRPSSLQFIQPVTLA